MDPSNKYLSQPFTPAVSGNKSVFSTATCASAPPARSSAFPINIHRQLGLSEPCNKSSNLEDPRCDKTPSPPKRMMLLFSDKKTQGSVTDTSTEHSSKLSDLGLRLQRMKESGLADEIKKFINNNLSPIGESNENKPSNCNPVESNPSSSELTVQPTAVSRPVVSNVKPADPTAIERPVEPFNPYKNERPQEPVHRPPKNDPPVKPVHSYVGSALKPIPLNVNTTERPQNSLENHHLQPSSTVPPSIQPTVANSVNCIVKATSNTTAEHVLDRQAATFKTPSGSGVKKVATPSTDQQLKKSTTKDLKSVKVNGKSYYVLSTLGQGGSSKVYQVYDPVNQRNCALKIVDLKNTDESVRAGFENEITLLTKLKNCERVVKLYDYERVLSQGTVRRLFLVMEKGDADLSQVLRNSIEKDPSTPDGLRIDPHTIKFYWKEMLSAVNEIHQMDVIHADLKPVNFITVSGKLKLIDFGIANAIETDHTSVLKDNQIGTINFMAPEALQSRNDIYPTTFNKPIVKFNCKADIWSLGCILYSLVYGRSPFSPYPNTYAKMQAIVNPSCAIEFPPISDQDCLDTMQKCLQRNARARPSARELLQHPYLTKTGSDRTPLQSIICAGEQSTTLKNIVNKINTLTPNRLNEVSKLVNDLSRK